MKFDYQLPAARTPDGMSAPSLRWGIVGPGWVAQKFVAALQKNTRQRILAVAGSSITKAEEFGQKMGIPKAFGSIEELLNGGDVDVVYISTPHTAHYACAMQAIRAGKHVLVEKPLAINAREVASLQQAAREHRVFLMEAMWSAFLPKFDVIQQVIEQGIIGEVHSIIADHGEYFTEDHRIMRPELAGGTLMDLGSYPVALATRILGPAEQILASGQTAPTGVNGQASIILKHAHGHQSSLHTTLFSHTPGSAVIAGNKGYIFIEGMFYAPGNFHLFNNEKDKVTYLEPKYSYDSLYHQAVHLAVCVEQGLTESPIRPVNDTLLTMQTLDEVRLQLGVVFHTERGDEKH
ncbi:gfo/Idh/MocA family oxidoreductase [Rouxiella sp. S1S-2]|uniref:Gfo/Idh/MocA family protein n=1 Tax=Rouxiella sp. S1S-2 TaxID=2653856 RepID=UPI00126524A0|nr:Gfo/Idh/MocA family oxidoreductase [Rouxiella sp. S1S-2]KAB7897200.1 gfo/Idh/MocA family oxidoreductase [Rouxiella sp. S1S-2]